ncbi:PH domain-containing protein [Alkalicoccobacillus porphyridii]|uniref:PH domain-containing protein n=1 Tax=Alkalicoccobacillus porphyridii TaxID=2597270 RepID=A0A554A0I4_9BACI|nr:PH domain-containing protein [Alkalicoccobacillus porphyridii]TSB47207.1 PH domain-containing protein [Alkalicoccobacillus porphyridii]
MTFWKNADNRNDHREKVEEFLLPGERLLQTYGLLIDFVALTDQRIIFVGRSFVSKSSEVVSIPYQKIEEVALLKDRRIAITNPVRISTRSRSHQLNLVKGSDSLGFYNQLVKHMLNASSRSEF